MQEKQHGNRHAILHAMTYIISMTSQLDAFQKIKVPVGVVQYGMPHNRVFAHPKYWLVT